MRELFRSFGNMGRCVVNEILACYCVYFEVAYQNVAGDQRRWARINYKPSLEGGLRVI